MKILVVEDETELLESLQEQLENESFIVETAATFSEAYKKIHTYAYDCIILDINLPDGNGLELLRHLKEAEKQQAVIILSARNSLDDTLEGLHLGADDYLPKPFHFAELHARIHAVLRRRNFDGDDSLQLANVKIDTAQRIVTIDAEEVMFNRKEFDILLYLMINKNRLVRKPALAEHVWGDYIDQADDYAFIYSQIKNVRKKLADHHAEIEIKAVYGMGYKLAVL